MAFPPRKASLLCALSNGPSGTRKPFNIVLVDELTPSFGPPYQTEFYAYNRYFEGYPNEVIVKSHINHGEAVELQIRTVPSYEWKYEFPNEIVYVYRPQSPYFEPVPDPNGEEESLTGPNSFTPVPLNLDPRWHTETALDLKETSGFNSYVPVEGVTYFISDTGSFFDEISACWTLRASVTNLDSKVLNDETDEYEYYPFKQATTKVEFQRKFKVGYGRTGGNQEICCWNKGTIIKGKVKFQSVNLITTARPYPAGTDYGFGGIKIEVGTTYADAGEADWEVEIKEGYSGAEIAIPYVSESITFINDFYVTEVIKPT